MDTGIGVLEKLYIGEGSFDLQNFNVTTKLHPSVKEIIEDFIKLTKKYPPDELEKIGSLPENLKEEMKQLGLFGLSIPKKYNGKGFKLHEYLAVIRTMAGFDLGLAIIPLAHMSIGVKGIILFGNDDQKKRYLTQAATGDMIFAYALTEPKFGSDAQHIQTTAILSEDKTHYILNGNKTYITNGGLAGGLTVFAQLDPERPGYMGAFIVETGWIGVRIGKEMEKMGLTISSTTPISFHNVKVPVENMLGNPGDGFKIAMTILNYGRLSLGAASSGVMEQSIKDMKKRSYQRIQFGKPIYSYELIQKKLVDAYINFYLCSAMVTVTAAMLEKEPLSQVGIESSHCKLFGTTRAWDVLYDAMQIAGGAGYSKNLPYEKRLRDFRVTTVFEGTTEIHSFYPPLMVVKKVQKIITKTKKGRAYQFFSLCKQIFRHPKVLAVPNSGFDSKGIALINQSIKRIRQMIFLGILLYRNKLSERQLYLRKITRISYYSYGLLCLLIMNNSARSNKVRNSKVLQVYRYIIELVKKELQREKIFFPSRLDRLRNKIFKDIVD